MVTPIMKNQLIIPALTLAVGIGIGVAVDRTVITTGKEGQPGKGQSSATDMGPRAAMDARVNPRGMSKAGTRTHLDRNAVATIRRVSKQLEMSPMISMDFEALLQAYEAIRWMNPEEVQMALGELGNAGGMNQNTMMLKFMLMGLWAKQDGKSAMEYATSLKQPMDKMMSVMSGVMGWMKHDPGTAYQWYKDNRGEVSGGMMGGMGMDGMFVSALAQQDLDTAFIELKELNGSNRDMALTMMAGNIGMDEVKRTQFIEQLEKLDDESLRDTGMTSMIGPWAMTDPQGATGYLEKMDPKPENYELLIESAASSWGATDPESAIQWLLENTGENEVEGDKIADTFGTWVMNDSEAAAEWLAKQPEGFATDELYSEAANNSVWMNPEGATQWAVKIKDEDKRHTSLMAIRSVMQNQGDEAVQKWKDGLDPEIRKEVVEFVGSKDPDQEHDHDPSE